MDHFNHVFRSYLGVQSEREPDQSRETRWCNVWKLEAVPLLARSWPSGLEEKFPEYRGDDTKHSRVDHELLRSSSHEELGIMEVGACKALLQTSQEVFVHFRDDLHLFNCGFLRLGHFV